MKEIYYSLIRRYSLLSSEHESVSVSHSYVVFVFARVFAQMSHKLALELHWIPSANNTTKTMSSARDPPPNPPPFNPRLNDARHPLPPPLSGDSDRPVFVRKAVQRRAIDYTANNLIHSAERAYTASLTRNPIQDSVRRQTDEWEHARFPTELEFKARARVELCVEVCARECE